MRPLRMNVLCDWEVYESKKRRSYAWPEQRYRCRSSLGESVTWALRLGARNDDYHRQGSGRRVWVRRRRSCALRRLVSSNLSIWCPTRYLTISNLTSLALE